MMRTNIINMEKNVLSVASHFLSLRRRRRRRRRSFTFPSFFVCLSSHTHRIPIHCECMYDSLAFNSALPMPKYRAKRIVN